MEGRKQIERQVVIQASQDTVWRVLSDSRLIADWVPAVREVESCSLEGEGEGAVRTCSVELTGKVGKMVERCVEFTPRSRIAYLVDEESFGMRRMFQHYGFALNVRSEGEDMTRVVLETHYTPKNVFYAFLNAMMMRRQFTKVCEGIVQGLKRYVEGLSEVRVEG